MKKNILQLTKQHVNDIRNDNTGNIARQLFLDAQLSENGFNFFLTDTEISDYENSLLRKIELESEIYDFLINWFDYDFEDFDYTLT